MPSFHVTHLRTVPSTQGGGTRTFNICKQYNSACLTLYLAKYVNEFALFLHIISVPAGDQVVEGSDLVRR